MGITYPKPGNPSVSVTGGGTDPIVTMPYGTAADWAVANPVLAKGEYAYETDTGVYKIGDGATNWLGLPAVTATPSSMPLQGVGARFRTLTIMTYHVVNLSTFQTDCDYYQEWNYTTVTLDQVLGHLNGTSTLAEKPLLITFDDGYGTQYNAASELHDRGMTGTWFLATNWIDGTQSQGAGGFLEATALTWTQVNQMKTWGMDIQAHTMSHSDMTSLTATQVASEFTGCKARIEAQVTGQTVSHLAYPYGAWNSTVTNALAAAGCKLARVVRIAFDGTYPGANLGRYAIASTLNTRLALPSAGTGYTDIMQPNFYNTLSADPELVADYGWESGGAKGWTLGTGFSVTSSDKHSGTYSLTCAQGTSTVSSRTTRMIPVDPFCRVAGSVWVKTSGLPSASHAKVQYQIYKPDGVTLYQTIDAVDITGNNGAWTKYTFTYTGDMNSGFLFLYCWLQGNGSPSGNAYWDDFSLKRENAYGPTFGWRA
jgi:peptidoglycan/xylan/chitin deacetylase (PgdA/CDA1 family)